MMKILVWLGIVVISVALLNFFFHSNPLDFLSANSTFVPPNPLFAQHLPKQGKHIRPRTLWNDHTKDNFSSLLASTAGIAAAGNSNVSSHVTSVNNNISTTSQQPPPVRWVQMDVVIWWPKDCEWERHFILLHLIPAAVRRINLMARESVDFSSIVALNEIKDENAIVTDKDEESTVSTTSNSTGDETKMKKRVMLRHNPVRRRRFFNNIGGTNSDDEERPQQMDTGLRKRPSSPGARLRNTDMLLVELPERDMLGKSRRNNKHDIKHSSEDVREMIILDDEVPSRGLKETSLDLDDNDKAVISNLFVDGSKEKEKDGGQSGNNNDDGAVLKLPSLNSSAIKTLGHIKRLEAFVDSFLFGIKTRRERNSGFNEEHENKWKNVDDLHNSPSFSPTATSTSAVTPKYMVRIPRIIIRETDPRKWSNGRSIMDRINDPTALNILVVHGLIEDMAKCDNQIPSKLAYYEPVVAFVLSDELNASGCTTERLARGPSPATSSQESAMKSPTQLPSVPPQRPLVLRHYSSEAHGSSRLKNVFNIPLGYANGAYFPGDRSEGAGDASSSPFFRMTGRKGLIASTRRRWVWAFVGNEKHDRRKMVQVLSAAFPAEKGAAFMGSRVNASMQAEIYSNAIFVPTTQGWVSYDCFRLYEAMISGAIPVIVGPMKKLMSAFAHFAGVDDDQNLDEEIIEQDELFSLKQRKKTQKKTPTIKPPPWIFATNWKEASNAMKDLVQNTTALLEVQLANVLWWRASVESVVTLLQRTLVNRATAEAIYRPVGSPAAKRRLQALNNWAQSKKS